MRWLGPIRDGVPVSQARITTWWQGNVAASTWTERNVSSVTENGLGDATLTFRTAYQATPCILLGGDAAAGGFASLFTSITASSVRLRLRTTANAAAAGRQTSVIGIGNI